MRFLSKKTVFYTAPLLVLLALACIWAKVVWNNWQNELLGVDEVWKQVVDKRTLTQKEDMEKMLEAVNMEPAEWQGKKIINVLFLGLDSRKEDVSSHCDAIHMVRFDIEGKKIRIISIPRGTYVYIPPGNYPVNEYYIGNACGLAGHEYAISQIEKMLGLKADYVIKVGFSQTLGIMRLLGLPTTESLQWLRNRQSFAVGDPQRSHNQAVFIKDVILKNIKYIKDPKYLPVLKIGYSLTDTDLSFSAFYALARNFFDVENGPSESAIETVAWAPYQVSDYHFDFENPVDFLSKYPIPKAADTTGKDLQTTQKEVIEYIDQQLESSESVKDLIAKRLWLQIEDEEIRENRHFEIIKRYIQEITDRDERINMLSDYILEKEYLGLNEWAQKAREELTELIGK